MVHVAFLRADRIELARAKDVEITRHRRSRAEANFFSARDLALFLDRHVRDRGEVFRDDRRQLKARAETRLIPAGKEAARIGRFELRSEHDLLRAGALFLIRRVIKSLALLVDLAGEFEFQLVVPRRQFSRQRERQRLLGRIEFDRRIGNGFSIERRLRDFDFERVEDQLPHWLAHVELYRFRSGKRALLDVRRDSDRILFRNDLLRQFSRSGGEVERFLCVQSGDKNERESDREKKTRREHPSTKQRGGPFASRFLTRTDPRSVAAAVSAAEEILAARECGAARRSAAETAAATSLHHQQQQQLPVANLRSLDDERTLFAELRFRLEQQAFFLEQLQVDPVSGLVVAFP